MGINPEAICKIRPQWKTLNERSFTRVTRRIRCLTILCHQKHIKMKESYKKYTPALAVCSPEIWEKHYKNFSFLH